MGDSSIAQEKKITMKLSCAELADIYMSLVITSFLKEDLKPLVRKIASIFERCKS